MRTKAMEAIRRYDTVEAACQSFFAQDGVEVQILPPVWTRRPARMAMEAMTFALVARYAQEEAVAGNWLKGAEQSVHAAAPTPAAAEDAVDVDTTMVVSFVLRNEAEQAQLERKRAAGWLTEMARRALGVEVAFQLMVDAGAQDKAQELRAQLLEEERRQVSDIAREMETAAKAERKEASQAVPDKQSGDRFRRRRNDDEPLPPLTIGRPIDKPVTPIKEIVDEMRSVVIEGRVFKAEHRNLPSGRSLYQFNITDDTDSITAKFFTNNARQVEALEPLKDGVYLRMQGQVQFDTYNKEIVFMAQDIQPIDPPQRLDTAEEKRVELHLHTPMSALDGVTPVSALIKQAAKWGHKAIAITDHGVVQSFPEAYSLGKKHDIQVILGLEAYVVDDGTPIVYHPDDRSLDEASAYVVFDTETTGLNAREDTLIEIAAVRMKGRNIVDTFSTLIDPERPLSAKITELTGISNDMLVGQPKMKDALVRFREFSEGAILVAHNAEFDVGFLAQCGLRAGLADWKPPVIDTLALARALYPGEKNYRLKTLTQKFNVELVNHHRALADAEATAKVFAHMQEALATNGIDTLTKLLDISGSADVSRVRPFHATILVQNKTGLRNLYELVSLSHTEYLYRTPRIPKSELVPRREGLLIGTACQNGELIQAFLRGKSVEEIEEICEFYDYLEIQPPSHYENLLREEMVQSYESIRDMHRQILEIAHRLHKPVVATGDVHFLNPEDGIYREVFLQSQHGVEGSKQPPLYLRTTDEMLEEFRYLGDAAKEVVVDNPTAIAAQIEDVRPIPTELYTPVIDGAEDEIRSLSYSKAREMYGDPLPDIVEQRLQKELNSIINNGFSVIYLIAHKLVTKSLSDGYLVGSRGSVGSSLVATMTDITEVNPLPPHYLCPSCKYSEFIQDGSVGSGFDLPPKDCPQCGTPLNKDGQDIPFETFLGFEGDKVPDIDLNFSGEYQPRAHKYTEELFGRDHVFRAGTISAVAEKTAYGYVRKFAEERGLVLRNAEIDRLVAGCTGVKRTTGQHPGGQVVVPAHVSIYDFTPVQYPADDKTAGTLTTHFDYHSGLESCLLKLDILGHDDPTVIRMLQDLTGVDPKTIPLNDPLVLGLFSGTETLGVKPEDIRSVTGTYAIPEFGTKFVRQMLEDTRPTTFSELVRISGLSHGTDVWLNNAQELIRNGTATLSEVICARDDIMVYLIYKGLEPGRAFKIMESIRKGKGVKEEDAEYMRSFGVPEWYIESGRKIKYMFPKAHATAYVLMAMRIAWFKIHHPLAFYATYFTVRADDFDVALMASGRSAIERKIEEIEQKGNGALPKEKSLLTVLEVALEMVVRGFKFLPVDLYESHATQFRIIGDDSLLPPFGAIAGVGEAAAKNLMAAREEGPFLSIEDLQSRSRVSKTVIEILDGLGCLNGLPETNQLSLF
ncbi:PolC-type DNA polymerase III [Alicyclobacillus cycloheptanicus]|nr:PolC-type DNA polymerase III [Alicyclobacillus cycloheptanicus]